MIPKISIIIPTYNVEKYIERCIESCVNQTLSEIEIICVDDNSKDRTVEILMNYQSKDNRIKVICLDKDSSALVARKRGVEVANGEFILFVDADDYLDLEAGDLLYKKIKAENVEILHFETKVIKSEQNIVSSDRIKRNQELLEPYKKRLEKEEVFNKFFIEKMYTWNLWNKLICAKLCKKAFSYIKDIYMPKGQDLYIYFVISYFAKSYLGWKSKPLYYYNFGNGYTGKIDVNLDIFTRYCYQCRVISAMRDFAQSQNILLDNVKNSIEKHTKKFINESISMWLSLEEDDFVKATNILFESWEFEIVLEVLTMNFGGKIGKIAQKIYKANLFPIKQKDVKVIGIYYHRMSMGGVQRVISLIIPMLTNLGYKVVLITEEESSHDKYIIDCEYNREIIMGIDSKNYGKRLESLKEIINKHSIDLILYHAWHSEFLLWDIMYLQSKSIPVIVHTHNVFTRAFKQYKRINPNHVYAIANANAIIALSKTDEYFWSIFNKNTKFLPNPIDPMLKKAERVGENNKIIIWSARISIEKQLYEALKVLREAIKYDSDIIMWVCGDAQEKLLMNVYKEKAKKMGIEKNIVFWGFQKNIYDFYKNASVNLITSCFEGYPMTLLEAKAHGLPTVAYNMPWLDLASEEKGTISVEQGDYTMAAKEIVSLLNNKDKWNHFSELSYNTFKSICDVDYVKELLSVLKNINNTKTENIKEKMMIETIMSTRAEKKNMSIEEIKKEYGNKYAIIFILKKFFKKISRKILRKFKLTTK